MWKRPKRTKRYTWKMTIVFQKAFKLQNQFLTLSDLQVLLIAGLRVKYKCLGLPKWVRELFIQKFQASILKTSLKVLNFLLRIQNRKQRQSCKQRLKILRNQMDTLKNLTKIVSVRVSPYHNAQQIWLALWRRWNLFRKSQLTRVLKITLKKQHHKRKQTSIRLMLWSRCQVKM